MANLSKLKNRLADHLMVAHSIIMGLILVRWFEAGELLFRTHQGIVWQDKWLLASWSIVTFILILQAWWAGLKYRQHFSRSFKDFLFLSLDLIAIYSISVALFPKDNDGFIIEALNDTAFEQRLHIFYAILASIAILLQIYYIVYRQNEIYRTKPAKFKFYLRWLGAAVPIAGAIINYSEASINKQSYDILILLVFAAMTTYVIFSNDIRRGK